MGERERVGERERKGEKGMEGERGRDIKRWRLREREGMTSINWLYQSLIICRSEEEKNEWMEVCT